MRDIEGSSERFDVKFRKYLHTGLIIAFAATLAVILWITLFSRLGFDSRHFYPPFWSYKAILNGSVESLFENIGNIVLFFPIGAMVALYFHFSIKKGLLIGLAVSLLIECSQWIFWLGSFEIDDLLHNTVGACIGAAFINRTRLGGVLRQQLQDKTRSLHAMACILFLLIGLFLGYQQLRVLEMRHLASLNNRADGAVNLLVLSHDPVYIGQTEVSVSYNTDGSIQIAGGSNSRAWIRISSFTLPAGAYVLEGMSGLEKHTVGLELAIFDTEQQKYVMLGHEVGAIDSLVFELKQTSKMEVLISIYPDWEGSIIARPVIYRGE